MNKDNTNHGTPTNADTITFFLILGNKITIIKTNNKQATAISLVYLNRDSLWLHPQQTSYLS